MKITIEDIAKEAGVSYQTISKALQGTGGVNPLRRFPENNLPDLLVFSRVFIVVKPRT